MCSLLQGCHCFWGLSMDRARKYVYMKITQVCTHTYIYLCLYQVWAHPGIFSLQVHSPPPTLVTFLAPTIYKFTYSRAPVVPLEKQTYHLEYCVCAFTLTMSNERLFPKDSQVSSFFHSPYSAVLYICNTEFTQHSLLSILDPWTGLFWWWGAGGGVGGVVCILKFTLGDI